MGYLQRHIFQQKPVQGWRLLLLAVLAMTAFAANSVLCRLALTYTTIDAASFTMVRILAGSLVLWLLLRLRKSRGKFAGNRISALALFTYAAAFSYAYLSLSTASGALLLFGAVQATMIITGLWQGERLTLHQGAGALVAFGGLIYLLLPGLTAPPLGGAALMLLAGVAWGVYSLRGRAARDPLAATAGNFMWALPLALLLGLLAQPWSRFDSSGIVYAFFSGGVASGMGYALWYAVLGGLTATSAATLQLSVPPLAAAGGVVFLAEAITWRLMVASIAILGGIALVLYRPAAKPRV
jgi:drug/metabolite transporter (DMT)-like permease